MIIDELIAAAHGGNPVPPRRVHRYCTRILNRAKAMARIDAARLWHLHKAELVVADKHPWFVDPSAYKVVRRPGYGYQYVPRQAERRAA